MPYRVHVIVVVVGLKEGIADEPRSGQQDSREKRCQPVLFAGVAALLQLTVPDLRDKTKTFRSIDVKPYEYLPLYTLVPYHL